MVDKFSRMFMNLFFLAKIVLILTACMPVTRSPISQVPPTATMTSPSPMRVVQGHSEESYTRISWSPDGRLLASGGRDNRVMVWNANTLKPVHTLTHPDMSSASFTSFSPNGRWLRVGEGWGDGTRAFEDVSIWDLESGTRLERVTDRANVYQAVWSPDGNVLAYVMAATDIHPADHIQFWVGPGGDKTVAERFAYPAEGIQKLHWLADGTLMAIKTSDEGPRRMFLWRSTAPETMTPLAGPYVDFSESGIVFSSDGSWVAAFVSVPAAATVNGVDVGLFVWETVSGDLRYTIASQDLHGFVGMAFSPDNSLLAIARQPINGTAKTSEVRIWSLATGGIAATLTGGSSPSLAFSPDGKSLAAGEANGEIRMWQLDSYLHPPLTPTPIPTPTPVPLSSVSPVYLSNTSVFGVNENEPEYLNSIRWSDEGTLQGGGYLSSTFSPDGSMIAYWDPGELSGPEAAVFGVYDAATNTPHFQIQGSEQFLNGGDAGIAWAPDGKRIFSQGPYAIDVFDVPTGTHLMTLENVIEHREFPGEIYGKSIWSPDGRWIASALQGGLARSRVIIWDAATGAVHRIYEQEPAGDGRTSVVHIAFSPDSSRLLLIKGNVEVLDVLSGELQTLPAGTDLSSFVGTGAWSADGVYVAVDYREIYLHTASVLIWNTETGQFFVLLRRATESASNSNLVWAPNRPWLATMDEGVVYIFDAERQSVIRLEPRTITTPRVLSWSPDGSRLAVGSEDRTVELWAFPE